MSRLEFIVHGTPGAQGSKKHVGNGVMVESSKKVKPWRSDVKAAAETAMASSTWGADTDGRGPVLASIVFRIRRPQSHYGTGSKACALKASAPTYVTSRAGGDVDKLLRSTFDALTASGCIADDSLIASVHAFKVYTNPGEHSGADVDLHTLRDTPALPPVYRGGAS